MTIRKISGFDEPKPCYSSEHNFPSMIVLDPGVYEHTCPSCGEKQQVVIPPRPFCRVGG